MLKKIILAILIVIGGVFIEATSVQMPEYVNVITEIQEIHSGSTYSLILKCDQIDPIITYAPATYEESVSDEIYRSFMPSTTIAIGISDSSGVIQETGSGVEIVLFGRLKDKIVGDYTIILTVEL